MINKSLIKGNVVLDSSICTQVSEGAHKRTYIHVRTYAHTYTGALRAVSGRWSCVHIGVRVTWISYVVLFVFNDGI